MVVNRGFLPAPARIHLVCTAAERQKRELPTSLRILRNERIFFAPPPASASVTAPMRSYVRPIDQRTGKVHSFAAFEWADDAVRLRRWRALIGD